MSNSVEPHSGGTSSANQRFELTQWSLIFKARDEGAPGAEEALEQFARSYWRPLYCFIRRQGHSRADAQDLAQDFYCYFREKRLLERINQPQGKFRSFLLTCLKNFLSDQRDRNGALKRGGGMALLPLDLLESEDQDAAASKDTLTPEQAFDRRWAQTVMDGTVACLRQEYIEAGKGELYEALKDIQFGERTATGYRELSVRLGLTESALKSAVLRLRRRYGAILREMIGRTVSRTAEIDDEIRHLIGVLGTR